MKKLICVAAAFSMVAGIAAVASAEVNLSGDARTRIRYNDSGIGSGVNKWDSRVRFTLAAKTESGAYAKARLRFLDGTWGTGNEYAADAKGDYNVWSDYAFAGFRVGNIDVAGGKMPTSFSPWFLDDERADRFRILYKTGGTAVALTFDKKIYEYKDIVNSVTVPMTVNGALVDTIVQVPGNPIGGDKDVYGVTFRQKFSDTAKMGLRVVWVADGTNADNDGLKASVNTEMKFAGNKIAAELSFKDGDTVGSSDDQIGGYVGWSAAYGAVTPDVKVGFTQDGFTADQTFGWLMVGGDVPTSNISRLGTGGDTIFLGASSGFQASEALSFKVNLAFFDIDSSDTWAKVYGDNPIEISGQAKYMVGKGVSLLWRMGTLLSDGGADDAFSTYGQMAVSF